MNFFREPRLGCYLALDLTYKTSLSYPSLLSAIQCTKNYEEASKYYQKALESVDENIQGESISELYFKYALMCDENNDMEKAYEYYNKCSYKVKLICFLAIHRMYKVLKIVKKIAKRR